jgi:hypothetical protein
MEVVMHTQRIRAAAIVATLFVAAAPLLAGPPWISVEHPSNPHHPATRGATFLVRAYHHSTALTVPVTGTAEGLVRGERLTVPLDIRVTAEPGVYAVHSETPKEGTWILVVTLTEGPKASATAVVRLGREGRIAAVDVPSDRTHDGWTVPRALRTGEIDGALREAARVASVEAWIERGSAVAGFGLLGALPLALLGVGMARARRRRV